MSGRHWTSSFRRLGKFACGLGLCISLENPAIAADTKPANGESGTANWSVVETVADGGVKAAPPANSTSALGLDSRSCQTCGIDWTKIPPVRPHPRPGMFTVPPTGYGYYTLSDFLHGTCREKPPISPYGTFGFVQPSSFDLDFRYLDKPDNKQHDFWDPLKRIHLNDDWMLSLGGQSWIRHMHEVDARLTTANDDHALLRTRAYADLWYRDQLRFFAEFIYADSISPDLTPLPIDINRGELQNAFVELKLGEIGDKPVYARAGRQELLFGSQRLISTLDWANTRRTFQGVRAYRQGEKFDVDAFWVQPVIVNKNSFDSVDNNQNFAGIWTTYKPKKGTTLDLYYLNLDQTTPVAAGSGGVVGGFNINTLGSRFAGDQEHFLWDFEGMLQIGSWANQDLFAQAATAGVGYQFADLPMNPQCWIYYDWASGEDTPGIGGQRGTFNQLFPFGHYYFGFLDVVGRRNIRDLNFQFVAYPAKWATGILQLHHFQLDTPRDALYGASGAVLRSNAAGTAGNFVGNEIDLVLSLHVTSHADVLLGWSKLFRGGFIDATGPAVSPELFYVQYGYRW